MAIVPLRRDTLAQYQARLDRLSPTSARQWGKFTPERMLAHLTRSIAISLGEVEIRDQSNWFMRNIIPAMVLRMPWPKGKIKAPPEFIPEDNAGFATERSRVDDALRRFVEQFESEPKRRVRSPFFGLKPLTYWAKMHGKHLDHHLRQFGA